VSVSRDTAAVLEMAGRSLVVENDGREGREGDDGRGNCVWDAEGCTAHASGRFDRSMTSLHNE
jgi:hypothetical protein